MRDILHNFLLSIVLIGLIACDQQKADDRPLDGEKPAWAIVIHGGAGNINPDRIPPEKEQAYVEKLTEALEAGGKILENGGTSLDAVEAAINILEDCPLFNAGKGAVFNADGMNEMDASIMDGLTHNAGAVAGVTKIKNPVSAARLVMDKSPHVMLVKEGAEAFAAEQGIELVDPSYFYTEYRWKSLQRVKEREKKRLEDDTKKSGTVGAVALDKNGNLAAATSTGGMTNKKWGRVGDSPIIGAGTWADNNTCGVSATGHGEFFIRNAVAHDISARMKYAGESLHHAANDVINNKLKAIKANGGVIAMDKDGNIAMPFNTSGMYRGFLVAGKNPVTAIFKEE